jgi:hypothetical protein
MGGCHFPGLLPYTRPSAARLIRAAVATDKLNPEQLVFQSTRLSGAVFPRV